MAQAVKNPERVALTALEAVRKVPIPEAVMRVGQFVNNFLC